MTHKERVMAAISHQQPDRVPKGELAIANDLLCLMGNMDLDRLMPFAKPDEVAKQAKIAL
jgi:hypothetical protein